MELGVLWLLARRPLSGASLAQALGIPLNRCHNWLQILSKLGLLEMTSEGYAPSVVAREAILNVLSQDTWAFQAREDRDSSLFVQDLALNITKPMSAWHTRSPTPTDYFRQIQEDPDFAARFTRKLYGLHLQLAQRLAEMLDLRGVKSMLDLGGGSGVVSLALLRQNEDLRSVVVDVDHVCRVGRAIARENGLENRIVYMTADFLKDELPTGFDAVMLCDVGSFSEDLFRRIHDVLNLNGLLIIVDKFATSKTRVPPSRLSSAFLESLARPTQSIDLTTADVVQARLHQAGFCESTLTSVPHSDDLPWNMDWTLLGAEKRTKMVWRNPTSLPSRHEPAIDLACGQGELFALRRVRRA